jgi:hypothetical protein
VREIKKWQKLVRICHLLLHILSEVEHDVAQLLPVDEPVPVLQNQNLKLASLNSYRESINIEENPGTKPHCFLLSACNRDYLTIHR